VTISDEDLDRWDARAKEYMDAPCYSFGPDVVAALVAEVRRLRGMVLEAHQYVALAAPASQVEVDHPALFAKIAGYASGAVEWPEAFEALAGALLRRIDRGLP
jgi:hypothetical protein